MLVCLVFNVGVVSFVMYCVMLYGLFLVCAVVLCVRVPMRTVVIVTFCVYCLICRGMFYGVFVCVWVCLGGVI